MKHKNIGSTLDNFLDEENILKECEEAAIERLERELKELGKANPYWKYESEGGSIIK